jgi:hypothetical protein
MKIFFTIIVALTILSCKPKEHSVANTSTTTNETSTVDSKTLGKVSHQFHVKSCSTVIIVVLKDFKEIMLEPVNKLEKDIDIDGLAIKFNYRPSRKVQTQGCVNGIPAMISEIEIVK